MNVLSCHISPTVFLIQILYYFSKHALNLPNTCSIKTIQYSVILWKSFALFPVRVLNFPLFNPTKTSSSLICFFFPTLQKDRREGRWCVTDAIFRLSVREINIDTVCFLPGASCPVCVCWALISLSSAQPLFSQESDNNRCADWNRDTRVGRGWVNKSYCRVAQPLLWKVNPRRIPAEKEELQFHQLL